MKRFFNFIYFVGISLLLFFCLLSIGKGFYLEGFLRNPVVTWCIIMLAVGTLCVIAFSESVDITNQGREEEPNETKPTSLKGGYRKIHSKLIRKTGGSPSRRRIHSRNKSATRI